MSKAGKEVAQAGAKRAAREGAEAAAEKVTKEATGKAITESSQRVAKDAAAKNADDMGAACKINSFVAGTQVLMGDGTSQPIDTIVLGDQVHAADPITGEQGPREVVAVIVGHGVKQLVELTIDARAGPDQVTATRGHPFWVVNQQAWITAGNLVPGDLLQVDGGGTATVTTTRHYEQLTTVYNLTVADIHTYYITLNTSDDILVHNCGGTPDVHGNNLKSRREATLYRLQDRTTGEHLKFGITSNIKRRYSKGQLRAVNAKLIPMARGSRRSMSQLERYLSSRVVGRLNRESWSAFIRRSGQSWFHWP